MRYPNLKSLPHLLRLIPQNAVNLLHNLRRQLLIRLNSLNTLINLLRPAGPRNCAAHILTLRRSREKSRPSIMCLRGGRRC
jgi:hypothetical protein